MSVPPDPGQPPARLPVEVAHCPACGDVRFSWGPDGPPQRRCWACSQVWAPPEPGCHIPDHAAVRAAIERLDGRVVRSGRHP